MTSNHKTQQKLIGRTFFALFAFFLVSLAGNLSPFVLSLDLATASDIQLEPYGLRPDINEIRPITHTLPKPWDDLKKAHISMIVELYFLYPEHQIYFLARDAELLFDTAQELSHNLQGLKERIHLLNISRANMRADHVKEYLSQEGISDKELKEGKKILFVDTGFAGTIPSVISSYFDQKYHSQLKTHLVVSANPNHPSSRVFLRYLNPAINLASPSQMHSTIISYEHLTRFTDRSNSFENRNSRWQPMSPINSQSDGSVSKEISKKYQEDLKFYIISNQGKA